MIMPAEGTRVPPPPVAGLHLLFMCGKDTDMDLVHPVIEGAATRVQPILQVGGRRQAGVSEPVPNCP